MIPVKIINIMSGPFSFGGGGDSCGPSNPLQNFSKVTSADRSNQQDRFQNSNQPVSKDF